MILLIGTGNIAEEYMKSLNHLDVNFVLIGNTKEKTENVSKIYNPSKSYFGGLESYDFKDQNITQAILVTPTYLLYNHLKLLLNNNIQNILVEKPGCLYLHQIKDIIKLYPECNIKIAYNRRFYESVIKAKEIIDLDDGITSFNFKITEMTYKIENETKFTEEELSNWFFIMTTHVVDLAFYLGGYPKNLSAYHSGYDKIKWYKSNSIFTGSGITNNNVPFSYHGDWTSSGKWGLEICTKNHLILFSPLEELKLIKNGSMDIIDININKSIYNNIKPGIFKQVKTFLNDPDNENLLDIKQHCYNWENYYNIICNRVN